MPTNHGIYSKAPSVRGARLSADEVMKFRYGIWRIFDALRGDTFLVNADERRKAAQLEHHFRTVSQRFVFTLQELNGLMQALIGGYVPGEAPPIGVMAIHFKAECLADHVLTYLNTIVDDVAIVISLATGFTPAKAADAIDSMGKLRRSEFRGEPELATVRSLLNDTDAAGSWWDLGFARGKGARQLLVHNHHLVGFQILSVPGMPVQASSHVMSPFAQPTFAILDFFGALRSILAGLFEWLDRLEAVLVPALQVKASGWSPSRGTPGFLLPVGYPSGTTTYEREYFPIPTCDGSDELPWSVTVQASG